MMADFRFLMYYFTQSLICRRSKIVLLFLKKLISLFGISISLREMRFATDAQKTRKIIPDLWQLQ